MEPSNLESARSKLEHSLDLLNTVANEIAADREDIASTKELPHEFGGRFEVGRDGSRWLVIRCTKVKRKPPTRWGLLVGDAMHNARSALDHLACRLVELNFKEPTSLTAFPIWDELPKSKDRRNRFERIIEGMSDIHKEGIRRLQPFANPDSRESAMLVALAYLDNLDKHKRLVPLVTTVAEQASVTHSLVLPGSAEVHWNLGVELKPSVEIMRLRSLDRLPTQIDLSGVVRITFGDPRTGFAELFEIRSYCVGIVESFAPDWS